MLIDDANSATAFWNETRPIFADQKFSNEDEQVFLERKEIDTISLIYRVNNCYSLEQDLVGLTEYKNTFRNMQAFLSSKI